MHPDFKPKDSNKPHIAASEKYKMKTSKNSDASMDIFGVIFASCFSGIIAYALIMIVAVISIFGLGFYFVFGGVEINGTEYNVDLFPPQVRIEKVEDK